MSFLFLVAGLFCLSAALFPFGPFQLSLILARRLGRWPSSGDQPSGPPETFAVCLCAYNEESVIRTKIEDLLALRQAAGELEILIYVDGASDRTAAIAREYGDRITLVDSQERRGKPYGMNLLVGMAKASIVLFTDANVRIDPGSIAALRRCFADPGVGCVCSHLTYINEKDSATSEVGSAYWRLDEWTKALETETGSAMGADGSLFAIRRALHHPCPDHLIDDLYVSFSILCDGYRIIRAADMCAFEPHTTVAKDEFRRKVRIACQCMGVHRALWPRLRTLSVWNLYKYFGHRFLRWIGGFLFLAAAFFLAASVWLAFGIWPVAAVALCLLAGIVLGRRWQIGLAAQAINVVLAFAGNTVGVWRAFAGEPVVTWDLAASARAKADGPTGREA